MAFKLKSRIIDRVEKTTNSTNGNPRFRVTLDDGSRLLTKPDSMFALYLVDGGTEYTDVPVTIEINGRGHIEFIEKEED